VENQKSSRHGFFIRFEKTCDGLGGTTQAKLLYERLTEAGFDVVLTREMGGTELGKTIREIILHSKIQLAKPAELFLIMADRAQHYKEVLKPSLMENKIVISDRYVDSTMAYQGGGRGWKTSLLWKLHQTCTGSLFPHFTVVLDGEPHRNRDTEDRFERMDNDFFARVKSTILNLSLKNYRYHIFNANQAKSELSEAIFQEALRRMTEHGYEK